MEERGGKTGGEEGEQRPIDTIGTSEEDGGDRWGRKKEREIFSLEPRSRESVIASSS